MDESTRLFEEYKIVFDFLKHEQSRITQVRATSVAAFAAMLAFAGIGLLTKLYTIGGLCCLFIIHFLVEKKYHQVRRVSLYRLIEIESQIESLKFGSNLSGNRRRDFIYHVAQYILFLLAVIFFLLALIKK